MQAPRGSMSGGALCCPSEMLVYRGGAEVVIRFVIIRFVIRGVLAAVHARFFSWVAERLSELVCF